MSEVRVKGTNFLTFLTVFERLHGAEAKRRTLEELEGEVGELLRSRALVNAGWYPVAWYGALHATAQRVTGLGPRMSFETAREGVKHDFRGIYRLLTFMLSPQSLLRKAPRVFSTYFNGGTIAVEAGEGTATVEFKCEGFDDSLWLDVEGGCFGVLEACGAKDVQRIRREGGRAGDATMKLELRWR